MNVLWLSHNVPYPPVGGVLQRNHNLLKQIASEHRVHLIAFTQNALLPRDEDVREARDVLEALCTQVAILNLPSDASRLAWYRLVLRSLLSRDPYTINWVKSRAMHARLKDVMQAVAFDVVYYDTISLVEYFGDTVDVPKVLNHHNIESSMMRRRAESERNLVKKLYFHQEAHKLHYSERRYAAKADVNITVSELDAERLQGISPAARIDVCENGTDVTYFTPGDETAPEPGHLLFVGGLKWYPNRDAILYFCRDVWPELAREMPGIRMTVVGAHPPQELVRLADADRRLTLAGYVDDVRPYFRKTDVFVCPIRDGGGTRLKLLDAMAMGKPIVTTSIGCEGLDVTPGQDVLIADTPEGFVRQIRLILSAPTLKRALGARARALAERRYSWDIIGSRLSTILEETAASRAGRGPHLACRPSFVSP